MKHALTFFAALLLAPLATLARRRASATLGAALRFKIEQCVRDGGPRDFETLHELRLALQATHMVALARKHTSQQLAGDLLMAGRLFHRLKGRLQLAHL